MKHVTETEWWNDLCHGIFGPRQGGAKIIIDAEDASTGVGKTGLAVSIAQLLSRAFDYELQQEDLTLSGAHYLDRWREHPDADQPSVIILDEMGGAGAGHSRRSMSTQNVELGNAWQLMRKKRIITIVTLPHWSKVDKDMRQQADYRLWCLKEPIGYFKPYEVGAGFDSGGVRTTGYDDVSRIRFPNLDEQADELYQELAAQKDELLNSEFFDADKLDDEAAQEETMSPDELRRKERIEIAQRQRDNGLSTTQIAENIGMSQSWVSQNTNAPDKGEKASA